MIPIAEISTVLAGAAVAVPCLVLAGTILAGRRLARLGRRDEAADGTEVGAPGGVLAGLIRARRHSEAQLDLQRNQFELANCIRGDQDPETLAAAILGFVLPAMGAQAGLFYVGRPGQRLVLAAEHGLGPGFTAVHDVRLGQGLVGQSAARRSPRLIEGGGEGLLTLDGPAGAVAPGATLLVPFHLDDRLKGLLVAAWRDAADAHEPEFLVHSAEGVAMALDSAHSRVRVARLLEATRSQAVMLARQQRELQANNDELARADRCKSEFLANMSHELRTPLNSMLIMSQVLAENRHGHLSPEEVDTAQTINRAGSELLLIINDILDMSRVEAGKLDVQPERVDLGRMVADLQNLFRPVAERQGLELRTAFAADAGRSMVSDPLRLSQILKNLLNNAFKFTERGSVSLTVRPPLPHELPADSGDEPWVAFEVADTGIGMSAETMARVCEPFYQGDGSIARRYGGSGLGLSISTRLALLLEGRLTVSSVEGRGSRFVFAVPVASAVMDEVLEEPAAPPSPAPGDSRLDPWAGGLAGLRVLLADADMRTVFSVSHVLDALEARVQIAREAGEALELAARAGPFDLVCVAPELFAGREDDLRRLAGPREAAAPVCVWLRRAPQAAPWLPGDAAVLDDPLNAPAVARVCAELGAYRMQRALLAGPKG